MRLIVWGTGKLFQRYKEYLMQFSIIKFCDSNVEKQGRCIDGIEIIAPDQLKKCDYDYIVIMTYAVEEICRTLYELNILQKKIILHSQIYQFKGQLPYVNHGQTKITLNEWIMKNERCILLVSHNYSYTGIPVALLNMANVLKKIGYSVLMAAVEGGTFTREIEKQGIDYFSDFGMCYQMQSFKNILKQMEAIVIGTLTLYRVVQSFENMKVSVLWWIHETDDQYYIGKGKLPKKGNVTFWAGGNRVKKIFKKYFSDVNIEKLQYYIPDTQSKSESDIMQRNDYMMFAVIGTIDERKSQDILMEAVIKIPMYYKKRIKIIMVGRLNENDVLFAERIREQQKQIDNLEWIQELTQEELDILYKDIDVLVCPSRDDPMPIVVTQAMMHGKVCIVSENVGQAEFITQQENGFVFPNKDSQALMKILMWLIDNRDKSIKIGESSRKIYDDEFSEKIMERRLRDILQTENTIKE